MKISTESKLTLVNKRSTFESEISRVDVLEDAAFKEEWKTDVITNMLMDDVLEFGVAKATTRQTGLTRSSMIPKYNRGYVLGYLNTTKALISIIDPDTEVITIDGKDYYYADYAVLENSAAEKLVATSGRIALTPKMLKRKKWCVDRIIENYDAKYLVSPSEYETILDTLFNGGIEHTVRVATVTPEKQAPQYLSSLEYVLPTQNSDRYTNLIELAIDGTVEGRVMTQVIGYVLNSNSGLKLSDVGTKVAAEVEDEVKDFFREYRKNKKPVSGNINNTGVKPIYHNEADSLGEGQK